MEEINGNFYDEEDIKNLHRLRDILLNKRKLLFNLEQCANIWHNYSSNLSASWLDFPKKDEDILSYIEDNHYFTSYEEYAKD